MSVLLLGGTAEARHLAGRLHADGVPVTSSLAGDVANPRLPAGAVRVGGFGGINGLATYLQENDIAAVVDATHPFAERITANAAAACATTQTPLLRLSRPSWAGRPDAATWHWADSVPEAKTLAEQLGRRVFLAIGRQTLGQFVDWADRYVLARVVDPPALELPASWELLRARGPFTRDHEIDLLRSRAVDTLVVKDSGGPTDAKLDAAAQLGVAVIVVRRPELPPGVPVAESAQEAAAWIRAVSPGPPGRISR